MDGSGVPAGDGVVVAGTCIVVATAVAGCGVAVPVAPGVVVPGATAGGVTVGVAADVPGATNVGDTAAFGGVGIAVTT